MMEFKTLKASSIDQDTFTLTHTHIHTFKPIQNLKSALMMIYLYTLAHTTLREIL